MDNMFKKQNGDNKAYKTVAIIHLYLKFFKPQTESRKKRKNLKVNEEKKSQENHADAPQICRKYIRASVLSASRGHSQSVCGVESLYLHVGSGRWREEEGGGQHKATERKLEICLLSLPTSPINTASVSECARLETSWALKKESSVISVSPGDGERARPTARTPQLVLLLKAAVDISNKMYARI